MTHLCHQVSIITQKYPHQGSKNYAQGQSLGENYEDISIPIQKSGQIQICWPANVAKIGGNPIDQNCTGSFHVSATYSVELPHVC